MPAVFLIKMSKLQRIVVAAAIVATLPVTNAAERVDADRIAACANERDDARRLACYDEAAAAARKPTSAEPAPAPPAPTAAPVVSSDDEFGVAGGAIARQRSAEEEQQQQGDNGKVESITAEVTAVSSRPHGELVMTLDNGQVWAQKKVERHFTAKPGDKVTINAGMLGSFRMVNGKRSTQVTRLK